MTDKEITEELEQPTKAEAEAEPEKKLEKKELEKELKILKSQLDAANRKWSLDEQRRFLDVAKLYAETAILVHTLNEKSGNLKFELLNELLPIGINVYPLVAYKN